MYYQEKWVGETLYVKTTPTSQWKIKTPTLADIYSAIKSNDITLQQGLNLAYTLGQLNP